MEDKKDSDNQSQYAQDSHPSKSTTSATIRRRTREKDDVMLSHNKATSLPRSVLGASPISDDFLPFVFMTQTHTHKNNIDDYEMTLENQSEP